MPDYFRLDGRMKKRANISANYPMAVNIPYGTAATFSSLEKKKTIAASSPRFQQQDRPAGVLGETAPLLLDKYFIPLSGQFLLAR